LWQNRGTWCFGKAETKQNQGLPNLGSKLLETYPFLIELVFFSKLNHSALKVQRFVLLGTESPSCFIQE
jgi:hypothetical protein